MYLLPRQKKRPRNFVDNLCTIFVNFLIIPRNSLILMLISYRDERAKNVHKFFIMLFSSPLNPPELPALSSRHSKLNQDRYPLAFSWLSTHCKARPFLQKQAHPSPQR